jgi:hypothetical protein
MRTHIGPEEMAYNTRNGGHSRSYRKAKAFCLDGKIRTFTAGVADSYSTVPAHGRINGRYVSGYLTLDDNGELHFNKQTRG